MIHKSQLPYLVRLLDDDSPNVREHVIQQLLAFGPELEAELQPYEDSMSPKQLRLLHDLIAQHRNAATRRAAWLKWPLLPTMEEQLEQALQLIAEFQYGWTPPVRASETLDDLAEAFLASGRPMDALGLSRYLFITKKFRGEVEDYYNPLNSNLIHVLQTRRGIPITLSCVLILVAYRAGMAVEGCNVPGHFLARAHIEGEDFLFDCFNRGRVLTRSERKQLRRALSPNLVHLLTEAPSAEEIIGRVLRNLAAAYERVEDTEKAELMHDLLRDIQDDGFE